MERYFNDLSFRSSATTRTKFLRRNTVSLPGSKDIAGYLYQRVPDKDQQEDPLQPGPQGHLFAAITGTRVVGLLKIMAVMLIIMATVFDLKLQCNWKQTE